MNSQLTISIKLSYNKKILCMNLRKKEKKHLCNSIYQNYNERVQFPLEYKSLTAQVDHSGVCIYIYMCVT